MQIGPKTYNMEREWAQHVVALAKANLIRGNKIAAGTLFNSVSYDVNKQTGEIEFYYAPEGEFVESGRRPNSRFPPPTAIAIKGIKPFPFFTDAIDQATQQLYNDLEDAIIEDIEDSIDLELKK